MRQLNRKSGIRVGLVQMRSEHASALNLAKAIRKVKQAAERGAKIVCLQELFKTDYFPQTKNRIHFRLAEPIPSPLTHIFSRLAHELKVVLIVPLFEKHSSKRYYNSAVVIDADGSILGCYRKTHLPNDPRYYEKFYFAKGNLKFKTYQTKYGKIGVLICWDQWFPEAARLVALQGAQILFYPSAIGWIKGESEKVQLEEINAWELVQRAHAIANGIYVAAVNRVGREGKITFWGNSFVSGPFGTVLKRASKSREEIVIADCDLSQIKRIRNVWPFLRERRSDVY